MSASQLNTSRGRKLPVSGRTIPGVLPWQEMSGFLLNVGGGSARTEKTYTTGLRCFADWLQYGGFDAYTPDKVWPLDPHLLTNEMVIRFSNFLRQRKIEGRDGSTNTAVTYMAAVISFLSYLAAIDREPPGIRLSNLRERMKRQRKTSKAASANVTELDLARQQIPRIVKYYDDLPLPPLGQKDPYYRRLALLRDRAIVHTLYSTVLRVSELVALNRELVGNGRLDYVQITGKNKRTRSVHFSPHARQAIRAYLSERLDKNPALFVAHSRRANGTRLSPRSVEAIVKTAVKALDLSHALSPHDFRHYQATKMLRDGVPIEVVQELLGHANISTTRGVYAPTIGEKVLRKHIATLDFDPIANAIELEADIDDWVK